MIATCRPSIAAQPFAHGEGVEQRLGRVLVRAVAGVDDAGAEPLGQELRRARRCEWRRTMISACSASRLRAVSLSVSPLREARGGRGDIDHVGAQAEGGQLERGARAGARLDEEIDQRLAAQRGDLLDLAVAPTSLKARGGVEDDGDFLGGKVPDGDQVLARPGGGGSAAARAGRVLPGGHDLSIQTESGTLSTASKRT